MQAIITRYHGPKTRGARIRATTWKLAATGKARTASAADDYTDAYAQHERVAATLARSLGFRLCQSHTGEPARAESHDGRGYVFIVERDPDICLRCSRTFGSGAGQCPLGTLGRCAP